MSEKIDGLLVLSKSVAKLAERTIALVEDVAELVALIEQLREQRGEEESPSLEEALSALTMDHAGVRLFARDELRSAGGTSREGTAPGPVSSPFEAQPVMDVHPPRPPKGSTEGTDGEHEADDDGGHEEPAQVLEAQD